MLAAHAGPELPLPLEHYPNLFVPDNKHRKTYIKWSVLFDSRPPGSTFDDGSVHDGPFMIHVNILTEEVEYF
jgi:hypothetical protein